jgi:uncharacterized protein (DUF433 family)
MPEDRRTARILQFTGRLKAMDRREQPLYSVEEASGFLAIPVTTLYSWTLGRRRPHSDNYYPAVLNFVDHTTNRLSFFDLVEAHILRAVIDQKLPLKKIKQGLAYLRDHSPDQQRPLLSWDFYTDKKHLLIGGMLGKDKDREALVNASHDGQLEITGIIEGYLTSISRDGAKLPSSLFPKNGQRIVSISSGVVSGRPAIDGTRIRTAVIAQRYQAGETIAELASDYDLAVETIEAAIQYEKAA